MGYSVLSYINVIFYMQSTKPRTPVRLYRMAFFDIAQAWRVRRFYAAQREAPTINYHYLTYKKNRVSIRSITLPASNGIIPGVSALAGPFNPYTSKWALLLHILLHLFVRSNNIHLTKLFNMKKLPLLALLLVTLPGLAQDCKSYYFLQNGKTVEMTITNKKGEPNGKQVYSITNVSTGGGVTTGTINSEMFDKKGKSVAKANSIMKCNGGVLQVDMKIMLGAQQQEQFAKAEATGNDIYLEYPSSMKVGDQLKDGNFHLDMQNNGLAESLTMTISERKVEAKESVTTAAGTWDCFKISFKSKLVVKIGIGIPINMEGVEWYAPGFGVVKSQSKYGGTEISSIK